MAEDHPNGEQPGTPAPPVEVVGDNFAMVVRLEVFSHQEGGQLLAAPMAFAGLEVHQRERSRGVLRGHVVSTRDSVGGKRGTVLEVSAGPYAPASQGVDQRPVGPNPNDDLWPGKRRANRIQSAFRFLPVVAHGQSLRRKWLQ